MADKKQSLVEEALLQMENLKEAVTENAKGILASTMKEEISQLVKESLEEEIEEEKSAEVETEMEEGYQEKMTEQEDDTDDMVDVDDVEVDDLVDLDNDSDDEEVDMDMDIDIDDDGDDDLDLDDLMMTDLPGDDLEVDDEEEILAPLDLTMATDDEILAVFKKMGEEDGIIVQQTEDGVHLKDDTEDVEYEIKMESKETDSTEDIIYEIEIGEEDDMEEGWNEMVDEEEMCEGCGGTHEGEEMMGGDMKEMMMKMKEMMEKEKMSSEMMEMMEKMSEMMSSETVEETMEEGMDKDMEEVMNQEMEEMEEMEEGYDTKEEMDEEEMDERSLAQGRRKGVNPDGNPSGGSKPGTGPVPNNYLYRKVQNEVKQLREKNEEYKKALNIFREKLTEVAVFNSNLAYATRLFTEHTTTKQEKINILRRFDGVETLKESKSLYKQIKNKLSDSSSEVVKESIESKVGKSPTTGSATNLIENKTYENPQFMRMRDLMKKL